MAAAASSVAAPAFLPSSVLGKTVGNGWGLGPFVKHRRPVLQPTPDSVFTCPIRGTDVRWEEQNTYYMNYTTWSGKRDTMSVATWCDLVHWTKHGPAFRKTAPEKVYGSRGGVVVSRLEGDRLVATKINGKYWMYYTHPCALAWFERSKLQGIKLVSVEDAAQPDGFDRIVVQDPTAPPMWARFYDIPTNRPIFCSRDGVPKRTLAEISYERRNGYSWLGYYAQGLSPGGQTRACPTFHRR
jgi:hypothetical protein